MVDEQTSKADKAVEATAALVAAIHQVHPRDQGDLTQMALAAGEAVSEAREEYNRAIKRLQALQRANEGR